MSATKEFKVGVFVIASVALGLGAVIALGSGTMFAQTAIIETSTVDSVNGLQIGSPVKYRGVPIGEVSAISFAGRWYPQNGAAGEQFDFASPVVIRMKVRLEVFGPNRTQLFDKSVAAGVAQGLRARLTTAGLTGGLYVDLDLNDPARFPAKPPGYEPAYAYVPSAPSQLDQLLNDINSIAADLRRSDFSGLSRSVQQAVDHIDGVVQYRVEPMLANADQFITELQSSNQQLQQLLDGKEINDTLANLQAVTGELRSAFDGRGKDLNGSIADIPGMLKSAKTAASDLEKIVAGEQLRRILDNLDKASDGLAPTIDEYRTVGEQLSQVLRSESDEIRRLVEALRRTAEHLEELTDRAKSDPGQVIFGDPPKALPPGAPGPKPR